MERTTSAHSSGHVGAGPKVSQIANIFQKRPQEPPPDIPSPKEAPSPASAVVRTESHAARFNHARALFERLGEGKVNMSSGFSIKKSNSRDDNLKDMSSPDKSDPPSPKIKYVKVSNGVSKIDPNKIHNVSRHKQEKPEKPEKPERKFNSRELIEKQKNWTSHFSKPKSTKSHGEFNRCDIIRAPVSGVMNSDVRKVITSNSFEERDRERDRDRDHSRDRDRDDEPKTQVMEKPPPPFKKPQISSPTRTTFLQSSPKKSESIESNDSNNSNASIERTPRPPQPPYRRDSLGHSDNNGAPEKPLPRRESLGNNASNSSINSSAMPPPPSPPHNTDKTEYVTRRREYIPQQHQPPPPPLPTHQDNEQDEIVVNKSVSHHRSEHLRRHSSTSEKDVVVAHNNNASTSPGNPISSSSSPGVSVASDPASPVHTEDEKQENEETEKRDVFCYDTVEQGELNRF